MNKNINQILKMGYLTMCICMILVRKYGKNNKLKSIIDSPWLVLVLAIKY